MAACSLATVVALLPALPAFAQHPDAQYPATPMIFQASVSYKASPTSAQTASVRESFPTGMITDAESGQPLSGVTVWVPDWQYSTQTRPDGSFTLPARPVSKPLIVSVGKTGYAPASATLDGDRLSGSGPFQLSLQREAGHVVVLDNQIHHLGDGSYAPDSAGAARFEAASEGPVLTRQFRLHNGATPRDLCIGSISGLDTMAAHTAGQSNFHRASSPMTVYLNGQPIGQIALNGDGERIPLPPNLLIGNGVNTIEIRTGYQTPNGRIDYDDMELMMLTLEL